MTSRPEFLTNTNTPYGALADRLGTIGTKKVRLPVDSAGYTIEHGAQYGVKTAEQAAEEHLAMQNESLVAEKTHLAIVTDEGEPHKPRIIQEPNPTKGVNGRIEYPDFGKKEV